MPAVRLYVIENTSSPKFESYSASYLIENTLVNVLSDNHSLWVGGKQKLHDGSLASVPMAENMSAYLAQRTFCLGGYYISRSAEIWANVNGTVSCPERLGTIPDSRHARSLNRM